MDKQTNDTINAKSLVYDACWDGLFSFDSFQIAAVATELERNSGGFTYTTSWEAVYASADQGCTWCNLLSKKCQERQQGEFKVKVALPKDWDEYTPVGTKTLHLNISGGIGHYSSYEYFHLYTTAGLRYIWIDALCILQDSTDDKNQQLLQMRRIYRDVYVTIIASCASKDSQGFLEDRPVRVPVARIPFRCPDGKIGTVCLASTSTDSPDTGRHYDELEPVNYRGWCLQEHLLSPRCLIYASHIVQYYCQKETVAIGNGLCGPTTGMRLPTMMIPFGQPPSSTVVLDRRGYKLVALAGVAEKFHRVWKTKYLAGLWQHTLLQDLLCPMESDDHGKCEMLECDVTLASEDVPFGMVTAGFLKINAPLKEARFKPHTVGSQSGELFVKEHQVDGRVSQPVPIGAYLDSVEEVSEVWLVPILWDRKNVSMKGLVLATTGKGCFSQVGYFSSDMNTDIRWAEKYLKQIITII
ncbi:hypothetical protein K440DRAFT_681252 [Wilcoxina mikolae CBS 423.85]|nr:hypothetical protein K440DRAFT_681252 [Wilcoxina mikolae CBS 423.85]